MHAGANMHLLKESGLEKKYLNENHNQMTSQNHHEQEVDR